MSKLHAKAPHVSPIDVNITEANIVAAFITNTPSEKGWWYRVPTHSRGSTFEVDELFPHLGTLIGLPDYVVSELLFNIGTLKKSTKGHHAKLDFWANFKSNHRFTNSNIEVARCYFEDAKLWCIKIGSVSKGPAVLHNENKKYGLHEPPKIRGQHRKVIKLISRGLGNLM